MAKTTVSDYVEKIALSKAPAGYYMTCLLANLAYGTEPGPYLDACAYLVVTRAQMHLPSKVEGWGQAFDTLAHARYSLEEGR